VGLEAVNVSDYSDQLLADAAQTFLGPDSQAIDIVRFAGGDPDDKTSGIRAIVDWDCETTGSTPRPGGREAHTTDHHGRGARSYCSIELLASQAIADGDRWAVPQCGLTVLVNFIRRTGSDEAMQTILCEDPGLITTKSSRLR
jgi:hypothetical protein